jgi:hypothetical protein
LYNFSLLTGPSSKKDAAPGAAAAIKILWAEYKVPLADVRA